MTPKPLFLLRTTSAATPIALASVAPGYDEAGELLEWMDRAATLSTTTSTDVTLQVPGGHAIFLSAPEEYWEREHPDVLLRLLEGEGDVVSTLDPDALSGAEIFDLPAIMSLFAADSVHWSCADGAGRPVRSGPLSRSDVLWQRCWSAPEAEAEAAFHALAEHDAARALAVARDGLTTDDPGSQAYERAAFVRPHLLSSLLHSRSADVRRAAARTLHALA